MDITPYKKYIFWGIVSVVVVVVATFLITGGEKSSQTTGDNSAGAPQKKKPVSADAFRPDDPKALPTVQGGTREIISKKIVTPEKDAATSTLPTDVAVPTSVTPIGSIFLRRFEIVGNGGKLSPSTIVINENDIIDIILKAVDGDYGISVSDFGVSKKVTAGSEAKMQFQGNAFGQYVIGCEGCSSGWKGTLIVNKKQ